MLAGSDPLIDGTDQDNGIVDDDACQSHQGDKAQDIDVESHHPMAVNGTDQAEGYDQHHHHRTRKRGKHPGQDNVDGDERDCDPHLHIAEGIGFLFRLAGKPDFDAVSSSDIGHAVPLQRRQYFRVGGHVLVDFAGHRDLAQTVFASDPGKAALNRSFHHFT